jgi:hypothetical protein
MNPHDDLEIQDALREVGWERNEYRQWVNPAEPGRGYFRTDKLLLRLWKDALAQAGRSDHQNDILYDRVVILANMLGLIAVLAFLALLAFVNGGIR